MGMESGFLVKIDFNQKLCTFSIWNCCSFCNGQLSIAAEKGV